MHDLWLLKTRYKLHCDTMQRTGRDPQNEIEWQIGIMQTCGGGYTLQKAIRNYGPWWKVWHWLRPRQMFETLMQMARLHIVGLALEELWKELLWMGLIRCANEGNDDWRLKGG